MEYNILKGNKGKAQGTTFVRVICEYCDTEIFKPLGQYNQNIKQGKRFFCNKECSYKQQSIDRQGINSPTWKGGKDIFICENCNQEFKVHPSQRRMENKFCSIKCSQEFFVGEECHNWKGGDVIVTCDNCGKEISKIVTEFNYHEHHFCNPECHSQWNKGENNPSWKGGISILSARIRSLKQYRLWKKVCLEREDYTCEVCCSLEQIEVHHVKPFSLILQDNNIKSLTEAQECIELWDEDNGQVLCKKCHDKITHRGTIK